MSMSTAADLSSDWWMETDRALSLFLREELHNFNEFPWNRQIRIIFEGLKFQFTAFTNDKLRVRLNKVLLEEMSNTYSPAVTESSIGYLP